MNQDRKSWMAALAKARPQEVGEAWSRLSPPPEYRLLRGPESGLVMVRGRMGGDGQRFNLGEMTVTRCTVECGARVGHAYIMGRDREHAERAAVFDALLQDPSRQAALLERVIEPLAAAGKRRRDEKAAKAAATKVEFFTMVRGEG